MGEEWLIIGCSIFLMTIFFVTVNVFTVNKLQNILKDFILKNFMPLFGIVIAIAISSFFIFLAFKKSSEYIPIIINGYNETDYQEKTDSIKCQYCGALNIPDSYACNHCGAPNWRKSSQSL